MMHFRKFLMIRNSLLFICMFLPLLFNTEYACAANYIYSENVSVSKYDVIDDANISVSESIVFENYGTINGNIRVCDACRIDIVNAGTMNVNVVLGANSRIVQIISGADSLKPINTNVDFDVLVNTNTVLNLSELMNVASGADKIILKNSAIRINGTEFKNNPPIEVLDEVKFIVDIDETSNDALVLRNIYGSGFVTVMSASTDSMYVNSGYMKDGNLYVSRQRENDYDKVFDAGLGVVLDDMRNSADSDGLFGALDNADSLEAINDILDSSVRFTPDILYEQIKVLTVFDRYDFNMDIADAGLKTKFILSDNFYAYGLMGRVKLWNSDSFDLNVGFDVTRMEYLSDLDEFAAMIYSLDFMMRYFVNENIFINSKLGAGYVQTDIDKVYYMGKLSERPDSIYGFMTFDVAYKYDVNKSIYVAPFVGVMADLMRIEEGNYFDVAERVGFVLGGAADVLGIKYAYDIRAAIDTDINPYVGIDVSALSDVDGIGGTLGLAAHHMYDVMSYEFTAKLNFIF